MILSLVTALLLPASMVAAHAVDRSTAQSTGLQSLAVDGFSVPAVLVDAVDVATGAGGSEQLQGTFRQILMKKKNKKNKKKKNQIQQAKKKAKKQKKKARMLVKKAKKKAQRFKWKGRGKNGFRFKQRKNKGIFKNGEIVYDADGIKCAATKKETSKIEFSKSAELHASAVAEAVEYLCNPPANFRVSVLEDIFKQAEAAAFAQAAVRAKLKCKSKGKYTPETCISYTASATAIAEATATAHAEAAAKALASCPCMTDVSISTFANADLYIELIADASVTAEATVCVEGKSKGKAVVWEKCTSVIFAKLFARALAHASTFGTCASPEATIEIEAFVDAEITKSSTPQCDVEPVCVGCDNI